MKTVDTGLGFALSVPEPWVVGRPSNNNKFLAGSSEDDFAVVVTDFGPVVSDASLSDANYRESFAANGLDLKATAEVTISGRAFRKYIFKLNTPAGEGHAEALMVPVGSEMYSVMVVTPAAALGQRRAVMARILESIAFKP
jgi:hypothetical protein